LGLRVSRKETSPTAIIYGSDAGHQRLLTDIGSLHALARINSCTGAIVRSMKQRYLHATILPVLFSAVALSPQFSHATSIPFGSHSFTYPAGTIQPNHRSQAVQDQTVRDFYDEWKAAYLSQQCGAGRYLILTNTQAGNLTVSEGHGYGMIIAAIMAGHDPDAQTIFDGMHAYFRDHPTATHSNLMSWYQNGSCNDAEGNDSASDGDLDIAFALLLADRQWGSSGTIDYATEALSVIADIKDGDLDTTARYVTLGDWVTPASGSYYTATRTSDFMMDHYRSFAAASGDADWTALLDETYDIIEAIQSNHSPATGLLPDFVKDPLTAPAPVGAGFLEGPNDGRYSYNACRDPWRLATDYLVAGDARAKAALDPINAWIRTETADDPSAIRAGYTLAGSPVSGSNYLSMAFVAPLGAAAMVDATNQTWLNDVWDLIDATTLGSEGYYENTLKLLAMMAMSGNWWPPVLNNCGDGTTNPAEECDDGNMINGDGCDNNCTNTACGNAVVTAGEQCDDGNTAAGDCCDGSCQWEASGASCDDGDGCTFVGECNGSGLCVGLAAPAASCLVPLDAGKSSIRIKDKGSKDSLRWKWGRGPEILLSAFGAPTLSDDYRLCVYDTTGPVTSVVSNRVVPASASDWTDYGPKGFKYKNSDGVPDGLTLIKLRPGDVGKAKILLKGKGMNLAVSNLGFDASATVTVQLHNGAGACFGASYSAPFTKNDSDQFKDKSDP